MRDVLTFRIPHIHNHSVSQMKENFQNFVLCKLKLKCDFNLSKTTFFSATLFYIYWAILEKKIILNAFDCGKTCIAYIMPSDDLIENIHNLWRNWLSEKKIISFNYWIFSKLIDCIWGCQHIIRTHCIDISMLWITNTTYWNCVSPKFSNSTHIRNQYRK